MLNTNSQQYSAINKCQFEIICKNDTEQTAELIIQQTNIERTCIEPMQLDEGNNKYLIRLKDSIQQEKLELIQDKLSTHAKYFFDIRSKTFIIYDHTIITLISREETRMTDLGKQHAIVQLAYNPIKNVLIFMNHDGHLHAHFINHKTQLLLRKDLKKEAIFAWVYSRDNIDLFVADPTGLRYYKIDEEKKSVKEVKSSSGKFNSFLYEPYMQVLVAFPTGDCRTVNTYLFDDESKAKNWFKGPEISINIENDESLRTLAKKNKSLGLHSSLQNYELFHKQQPEQFSAELLEINNKCYIIFYFGSEGKLKLTSVTPSGEQPEKEIIIKLPSDCWPTFNVLDSMLVIHINNEKITFIYDICNGNAQMLVSPFPVEHSTRSINPYAGIFRGSRHIMPNGYISKWVINIGAIFHYLKNQLQIFDFLIRREKAKGDLLKWLRENLLRIKQLNLSKFWKMIFVKLQSSAQKECDLLTLSQLYANVFYTLSVDELTPKEPLLNIIIECVRQAKQMNIKMSFQFQRLLFDLMLENKRYEALVFLCHNDVIKDSEELVQILMRKASKDGQQILLTLAIDMANRVCKPQKVFEMLILSQNVWEARRYLKQNYENIEVQYMIYASKGIKDPRLKQEYIKLTRAFIFRKFSSISQKYLNEAEQKIYAESEVEKPSQEDTKLQQDGLADVQKNQIMSQQIGEPNQE